MRYVAPGSNLFDLMKVSSCVSGFRYSAPHEYSASSGPANTMFEMSRTAHATAGKCVIIDDGVVVERIRRCTITNAMGIASTRMRTPSVPKKLVATTTGSLSPKTGDAKTSSAAGMAGTSEAA